MPVDKAKQPASTIITVPRLSPNDDAARLVSWLAKPGDLVTADQAICAIETTKAVAEVVSSATGYFLPIGEIGSMVEVNAVLAIVSDSAEVDQAAVLAAHNARTSNMDATVLEATSPNVGNATRKAQLLAQRYGIDLQAVTPSASDGVIREHDVAAMHSKYSKLFDPSQASGKTPAKVQRVLIIGSVRGGGAAIVADILLRSTNQIAVGVLDSDPTTHGTQVLGVPVLGTSTPSNISRLHASGAFDAAIVAFNRDLSDRATIFGEIDHAGIPFANAIDPSAEIRAGAYLGRGNIIAAFTYVGAEARIGDNNFLSSRTTIEHHCVVGSHCAFGPAVTFSGFVKVGDRVRFGTQIAAEPNIEIGSGSIIASSSVLTANVASDTIVRAVVTHRAVNRPPGPRQNSDITN